MAQNRKAETASIPKRTTRSATRAQDIGPPSRVVTTATRGTRQKSSAVVLAEKEGDESEDELNIVSILAESQTAPKPTPKSRMQPTRHVQSITSTKSKTTCTRPRKRAVKEGTAVHDEKELPRKKRKLMSSEPEELSASSTPSLPRLGQPIVTVPLSPQKLVSKNLLPSESSSALLSQKRAVLHKLQHPTMSIDCGSQGSGDVWEDTNDVAAKQVADVLEGTAFRGEGNSCMVLGPRGSGKTHIVERCIANLPESPIVIRLCGWLQYNDRLAIHEIAYQLNQQAATQFPFAAGDEHNTLDDDDPFAEDHHQEGATDFSLPSAYIHTLISCIPTLSRPTVLILDAFDLFTFHPRQSLLYSLLDTVQSCTAEAGNKGMAVIGITTRMDTLNLFEKRVKSRFSGRMIRTAPPKLVKDWLHVSKDMLLPSAEDYPELRETAPFQALWQRQVDDFLAHGRTIQIFEETFALVRDVRFLIRLLTCAVLNLNPTSPWLTPASLEKAAETQRIRIPLPQLPSMSYPSLCLLVASMRAENLGYPALTFEMLYTIVRDEIRGSNSAPVQLNGMSIGMHRVSRSVLSCAFEHMVSARIFVISTAVSVNTAREFIKYRCVVQRVDVDKAVGVNGQHGLKTWWKKVKGN